MPKQSLVSLRQWIWRVFAQIALIPLLLVEALLIAAYLLTNSAIRDAQIEHLRETAQSDLQASAAQESRIVDEQLAKVDALTNLYRNLTAQALAKPATAVPGNLALSADGVRYTPRDEGGAAVFYANVTPPEKQDLGKIARLAPLEPLMKEIKDQHSLVAALYFNSWDSLNHIYPWFLTPDQYPHDMDIPNYNFYYLADAEHNPSRDVVWTDVYLDPAGQGWMMSAIAPVYRDTFLEGVVGIDITVGDILKEIGQLSVPWNGYAMLVSKDLNIMALPKAGEDDFGLDELTEHSYDEAIRRELFKPEDFNLAKRAETVSLAKAVASKASGIERVVLGGQPHLVAWSTIAQTDWHLLTVVAEADVFAQTNLLAGRYKQIGYLLIAGLVLFYVLFFSFMWVRSLQLSRQLHGPITGISTMMAEIGRGNWRPQRVQVQIRELDDMAGHALEVGGQLEQRNAELRESYQAVIRSLGRAACYKDNETGNHILRIGESAALIASALGFEPDFVKLIRMAAPMHDIGKIGIPDAILGKPGALTPAEREIMNHHARIGYEILLDEQRSPLTDLAAEVALYHHERWDGSGYPQGLKGEDIPLAARIVALSDVYDALRSPRPYKSAWSAEAAQAYILEQSGKQFDPQLVTVMASLFTQLEDLIARLADDEHDGDLSENGK